MGSLIVFEGIDGSGKSSLAQALIPLLGAPYEYCSHKSIGESHPHVAWSMRQLASLLWPEAERKHHAHLLPPGYWLALQVAWYEVLWEQVIKTKLASGTNLIVDGWVYKFMAKLLVEGEPGSKLYAHFGRLVQAPDRVILLQPSPTVVWQRKRGFSPFEMGSLSKFTDLGELSFINYQTRVEGELLGLARALSWQRLEVGSDEALSQTAQRLAELLSRGESR